jgi:hypothetical protein
MTLSELRQVHVDLLVGRQVDPDLVRFVIEDILDAAARAGVAKDVDVADLLEEAKPQRPARRAAPPRPKSKPIPASELQRRILEIAAELGGATRTTLVRAVGRLQLRGLLRPAEKGCCAFVITDTGRKCLAGRAEAA